MRELVTHSGVILISGAAGAGKSTVAHLLAKSMPRAAHIETDRLQDFLVSGRVRPNAVDQSEALRQLELRRRNQASLADNFNEVGIVPIIDDVFPDPAQVAQLKAFLRARPLLLVTLSPPRSVAVERLVARGRAEDPAFDHVRDLIFANRRALGGLWIDNGDMTADETVATILGRVEDAVV